MRRVQIPHGDGSVTSTMSQGFGTPAADESAALPHFSFRFFLFLYYINYYYCNLKSPG